MAGSLTRVLRLRAMVEELGRLALEEEVERQRKLEQASAQAELETLECRRRWFRSIPPQAASSEVRLFLEGARLRAAGLEAESGTAIGGRPGSGRSESEQTAWSGREEQLGREEQPWRSEEGSWQLAARRGRLIDAERPRQQRRVEEAREGFLAERRARLEVETLVDAAAAAERRNQDRRLQQQLDEWFQGRPRSRWTSRRSGEPGEVLPESERQ